MTLRESLQLLLDGQYSAIKLPELLGYITIKESHLDSCCTIAVDESPQTETKEVKRWLHLRKDGTTRYVSDTADSDPLSDFIVELTGTIAVEVKPKVQRREEVVVKGNALYLKNVLGQIPADAKFFAEWSERQP